MAALEGLDDFTLSTDLSEVDGCTEFNLLSLLDEEFAELPDDLAGPHNEGLRRHLARHFVQRRRVDIDLEWLQQRKDNTNEAHHRERIEQWRRTEPTEPVLRIVVGTRREHRATVAPRLAPLVTSSMGRTGEDA